jgi:uncharacterized protein
VLLDCALFRDTVTAMSRSDATRAAAIAFFAALIAACAGTRAAEPAAQVKVEVASVGIDSESGSHYVLLADKAGKRALPIMIGETEADAIMLELHGIATERPLTHDLLRSVIRQTGNHVDRVEIGDLRDETYYATIYLDRGVKVDSRPSDAIALAIGSNAPIYVATRLLQSDAGGIELGRHPSLPEASRGLGLVVQELTAALGTALGEQPHSGVLVAEVEPDAARAGVQRGDIVTSVGGRPIKTLKDFDSSVAALKPGDSVELTLKRGGAPQAATLKVPPPRARNG